MINDDNKISGFQLGVLLFNAIIGVGVLSLPSVVAQRLGTDGWILILVGGIIAIFLNYILNKLTIMFEGKTFIEFGRDLVTTPISNIIGIIYCVFFLVILTFELRIFGEVIKMFLLEKTPIELVILTMIFVTSYLIRLDVEDIGRMTMIIFPVILLPVIILAVILFPTLDLSNLLPLFRFSISDLAKGIPDIFFSFIGVETILIFMAYVRNPKEDSLKYSTFAILGTVVIYLITFFVTLTGFGVEELKNQIWSSLAIMKSIDFPGAFIENLEGLIMTIWGLVVFTTIVPIFYSLTSILSKMFRCKKHSQFVLPVIPIVYILSLMPDNLDVVYKYMDIFVRVIGTLCVMVIPTFYFIIALIRNNSKKEADTHE